MSNHDESYLPLMNKVLDGEASAAEISAFQEHLSSCERCRLRYRELKQSTALLNLLDHPQLPPDFTKHVLEKLPVEKGHVIRTWTGRHPLLTTVAVCAVPMSIAVLATRGRQTSPHGGTGSFVLVKNQP
ncbi:MAG: zf-HC2 domain-containing protein [Sporolactobacillus sp.]|jgi:anti-sigma factor RsiW|nr:zf-HC2 domain-containing protein [Sporolactobacillus sp.]